MGLVRIASLIALAGLIAAPALAQTPSPAPHAPPLLDRPAPDAKPKLVPKFIPNPPQQKPVDPCDPKRGRLIAEPEHLIPYTGRRLPRPYKPGPEGRLCLVKPAV